MAGSKEWTDKNKELILSIFELLEDGDKTAAARLLKKITPEQATEILDCIF